MSITKFLDSTISILPAGNSNTLIQQFPSAGCLYKERNTLVRRVDGVHGCHFSDYSQDRCVSLSLQNFKFNTIPILLNIWYKPFSRVMSEKYKMAQKPVYWLVKCTLKYCHVFSDQTWGLG
jgi:hypothetical protein